MLHQLPRLLPDPVWHLPNVVGADLVQQNSQQQSHGGKRRQDLIRTKLLKDGVGSPNPALRLSQLSIHGVTKNTKHQSQLVVRLDLQFNQYLLELRLQIVQTQICLTLILPM